MEEPFISHNILMDNNQCQDEYLSVVIQMSNIILKAQVTISRAFKKWKIRQLKDQSKYLVDIYYESPLF